MVSWEVLYCLLAIVVGAITGISKFVVSESLCVTADSIIIGNRVLCARRDVRNVRREKNKCREPAAAFDNGQDTIYFGSELTEEEADAIVAALLQALSQDRIAAGPGEQKGAG